MTTLEIVLIVALAYSVIAHIVNFINIGSGCLIADFEDLLVGILWPAAIVYVIIEYIKHKKKLDKSKSQRYNK